MTMIKVVCGIIYHEEKVLITRRKKNKSLGGYWEFPGGKVEDGEDPETALIRELKEELGMDVSISNFFTRNNHNYGDFEIELSAYRCEFMSASFKMTDHDKYEWVKPEELLEWEIAPADIPIAKRVL